MLKVITESILIAKCQENFVNIMSSYPLNKVEANMGFHGGIITEFVNYYKDFELWFITEPYEIDKRYWNPFGIGNPNQNKNVNILIELNFPFYLNRRVVGVFLIDDINNIYIGHRGLIGGSRKGIGKTLFFENYNGNMKFVEDDGRSTQIAIISSLDDNNLLKNIKMFVDEISRIKKLI